MKKRHVIVVGGGASGLVAAIAAAKAGADVTILEQKERLGKKILSTGNGRCNLTNQKMDISCFRSDDLSLVTEVLNTFGYPETCAFFAELGVLLKDRQGYVYPLSDQAGTILESLCLKIEYLGIEVQLNQTVRNIERTKKHFSVRTDVRTYLADAVILATGGKAAPVLGSDGSGYSLAKSFGHSISPVVPALVQLKGKGKFFTQIAGIRTQAKISLYVDERVVCQDTGELQLTNYGLSGIPVFQISRYAAKALYENKSVTVKIDFLPSMSEQEFTVFMRKRLEAHGYKKAEEFLLGIFPKKLIGLFLKASRMDLSDIMCRISDDQFSKLLLVIKQFQVEVTGTNPFEQAQVCAGGVRTCEVHKSTLESIYVEDLYLTGELLDVDGICGGYNLQWAWATGFLAGHHAAKGN